MELKRLDGQIKKELSMIEVAQAILEDTGEVMEFTNLLKQIVDYLEIPKKELDENMLQFYTDLNIDGSFISLGDNRWGLRAWYPIDAIDEEITHANDEDDERPKRKKRKKKKETEYEDEEEYDEELDDEDDEDEDDEDEDEDELATDGKAEFGKRVKVDEHGVLIDEEDQEDLGEYAEDLSEIEDPEDDEDLKGLTVIDEDDLEDEEEEE